MKELALPASLPPLSGAPRLSLPRVTSARLPNGLDVRVVPREGVPLVAIRLVFRGGRSLDAPSEEGFADLLADMLQEGSASRTGAQVAEALQGAGASLETTADEDALSLFSTALPRGLSLALETLAEVAGAPGFREADVARVRAIAAEELATRETEPAFVAERAFRRALYPGHPYAAVAPSEETIAALRPEALHAAARARLVPGRAILFLVGSLEPDAALELAARAFGAWRGSGGAAVSPPVVAPPAPGMRVSLVARPGSVQTVLLAGTVLPPRAAADAASLRLANAVFGGAFSSRLVENLREEKGYAYSPGSRLAFRRCGGPFAVHAAVRNEVTGAAFDEILHELRRMATTTVTPEELDRARARESGALASAVQTNAGLALELARLALEELPAEELSLLVERFGAADAAALRAVSARHLAGPGLAVAAVGDRETIRRELAPFGADLFEETS